MTGHIHTACFKAIAHHLHNEEKAKRCIYDMTRITISEHYFMEKYRIHLKNSKFLKRKYPHFCIFRDSYEWDGPSILIKSKIPTTLSLDYEDKFLGDLIEGAGCEDLIISSIETFNDVTKAHIIDNVMTLQSLKPSAIWRYTLYLRAVLYACHYLFISNHNKKYKHEFREDIISTSIYCSIFLMISFILALSINISEKSDGIMLLTIPSLMIAVFMMAGMIVRACLSLKRSKYAKT